MILSTDMAKHFEILGRFRTRSTILNDLNLDKFDDKLLIFSAALKTADIGHSAKYTDLHQKWTKLLMEEFFKQGDMEKSRGYPISMYCDRSNTNIGKSQAGFLRNICLPLFEVWTKFLNSATINRVLEELKKNIEFWENVQKSRRATQPVTSDTIKLTSL
jgi:3',5'-cyclic-nucleotide phosphodiesterase